MANQIAVNTVAKVEAMPKMTSREHLSKMVRDVNQTPFGTSLPAFWDAKGKTVLLSSGQAALATLYHQGLLDCSGKPGSVSWYLGSRYLGFTKVNGLLKTLVTFYAFMISMIMLMVIGTQEAYVLVTAISAFSFVGYFYKSIISVTYRHLVSAIPTNGSARGLSIKIGVYTVAWLYCAAFIWKSTSMMDASGVGSVGFSDTVSEFVAKLSMVSSMPERVMGDALLGVGAMIVVSLVLLNIVGAGLNAGQQLSIDLAAKHGQYSRLIHKGGELYGNPSAAVAISMTIALTVVIGSVMNLL